MIKFRCSKLLVLSLGHEEEPRDIMIERFKRIATILKRFRLIVILCAFFSFLMMLLSFSQNRWFNGEFWLIPSLLAFGWSLLFFSMGELFASVPELLEKQASWTSKVSNAIRRAGYKILAIILLVVCLSLIILSYQLLRTWYIG